MNTIQDQLITFSQNISEFHIPRWEELPDIELYMDQVITFIENNLFILPVRANEKIITSSMINNYVKLNLIPKPIKKRYNKIHLAYLIAISILKQVFTIQEVHDGIRFQAELDGEKIAYNSFCEAQEQTLKLLATHINMEVEYLIPTTSTNPNNLAIKMATLAFASKIIGEKVIGLQKDFVEDNTIISSLKN